jgi:hypothetical protein
MLLGMLGPEGRGSDARQIEIARCAEGLAARA